jgi:hypothetical protein
MGRLLSFSIDWPPFSPLRPRRAPWKKQEDSTQLRPRVLMSIRNRCHDANTRSSSCLPIAGIPLPRLTAFWPVIPGVCSAIVCAPRQLHGVNDRPSADVALRKSRPTMHQSEGTRRA